MLRKHVKFFKFLLTFVLVVPKRKNWCWAEQQVNVEISDKDVKNIELVHSGYHLKCSISHNITLVRSN